MKDKVSSIVKVAIVVVVALILAFNAFYQVGENEQAVVTTFGNPKAVSSAGIHVKVPFIQKVTKVDTTIKGIAIGYQEGTEYSIESESLMITSDYNFVNVDFYLEYRVSDPLLALYASENPTLILKNIAQGCIRSVIGTTGVDAVITTGKNEIQSNIREMITAELTKNDIGIQLVNITIQDAEPPTEAVKEAFKAVETAKQGKETAINNANKYKSEQIPAAKAKVDKVIKDAEAQKQARINEGIGQASRFEALFAEYKKYPLITKQRMFYEAMQDILPDMTVYINGLEDGGNIEMFLPLEPLVNE
ncbi:MAG: FtsH protease activity modulator HflK [Lachnospiraceae bacterium]|nr:FtsH protease activity modulator HflK [Lachnospiraceae bacterium]